MRPLFEPRLVKDTFGDPGLYVDFCGERRALLFDFGDVSDQPARKLLRIADILVSHTHVRTGTAPERPCRPRLISRASLPAVR